MSAPNVSCNRGVAMFTEREQKVIHWLEKKNVATMRELRDQFQLSHMTVLRALKKYGYYNSYNHNAKYYVLRDVPEFNQWGLWTYRDIGFSKHGPLTQTITALVNDAPGGWTVAELEELLQSKVANLVSRLVRDDALQRETFSGRQAVYMANDPEVRARQRQQRLEYLRQQATSDAASLPEGCLPTDVIEVLRQMILAPQRSPEQLARRLKARDVDVTAGEVRRVIDYYGLKKNDSPHAREVDISSPEKHHRANRST